MNEKLGEVSREKYWEEKTVEEKVETLAQVSELIRRDIQEFHSVLQLLKSHSHSQDGEIQVPLSSKEHYVLSSPRSFLNRKPEGR